MKRLATVLQTSPRQKELMDIVKKTYQSHFYKGVLEINKVDQRAFYSSEDAFSELARTNKYTESYFAKPYNPTHVDLDQKQLSEAIQLLSNELKGYEKMVSDLEDNGAHLRNLKQYDQRLLAARVKDRELNDSFLKKAKLALLEKEKSLGHSITENRREQIDRSLASGVVAQATPRFPSELGLAYYFLYFRFESVRSRLRLME